VKDNVSRLSIHIVSTLLGNSKVGMLTSPPSLEKSAPSPLLSRLRHLGRSPHRLPVRKSPHCLLVGKSSHRHCPSPSRPWHHPPLQATSSHELFYLSYQKQKQKSITRSSWLQLDLVLVLIQTCWIQISLAFGFVGYWRWNFLIILGALARLPAGSQVRSLTS